MNTTGKTLSSVLLAALLSLPASAVAQPQDPAPAPAASTPTPAPAASTPTPAPAPAASTPTAAPAGSAPVPAPPPTVPTHTPEELEVLAEIEADLKRYTMAAEQHHHRMRSILRGEYKDRKQLLESRYAEKIAGAETASKDRRLRAIALLEQFIKDYPDHKQFTPDAMFRLADLYLDQANYEFEQSFEEDLGSDDEEGLSAVADYSKSLALWEDIIRKFPDYRQKAGTLYLLGYYLKQTDEERRALQVYRGLVCNNKYDPLAEPQPAPDLAAARAALGATEKKPFIDPYADCQALTDDKDLLQDVWVRGIGDIHFLTAGELNEAIASYRKVADDSTSKFYDQAMYKLAWSYYRNDDFLKGIEVFDRAVVYSDSLVAQGKDPLELRPEVIQYIAISFTDPWSVDEQPDPVRSFDRAFNFYKDRFDEPHVRDVLIQLGETFLILEAYTQAADSWRLAINKWPLAPDNPLIHQKIVSAYEEMGDNNLADEEAGRLAMRYAPGGEWYTANETNLEAMETQERIGEHMLRAAAENTHRAAQAARQDFLADPSEENRAKKNELYLKAAELYDRFLHENPTSDLSYEFTYRLAETLFFAEKYIWWDQQANKPGAVYHYRWVRDHRDLSETRFEASARSIVQVYQNELERAIAANEIAEPPLPTIEQLLQMQKPIQPQSVPEAYRSLQTALDEYQKLVTDPQTAPNMGYQAALISYRHLDLADAEVRFQSTLKRFCGTDQAVKSKDALLAIYEAQGEDDKFKKTNQEFISSQCGTESDVALAKAQNRSKEFREAETMVRDGRNAEAAITFYRYYKNAPESDPNRPTALYNSAIAYDRSGKPKTAVYLFKEFTDNSAPEFKNSEYFLPALYLTAVSYYKAFDYDNAVRIYLDVVKASTEKNRKPPAGEQSLEEMRLNALFNAASLRELSRVYTDPRSEPGTGAVSLFERYAKAEPDRRKADRGYWAIARVWKNAKNLRKLAEAYDTWRSKYGRDADNSDDYVYSYWDLAKEYEKAGNSKAASKMKAETLKAWNTVGKPKNAAASDMAAEFAFEEAEAYYKKHFQPLQIKKAPTTKKEAEKVLGNLDSTSNATRTKYQELGDFQSGPYGLAALVRIGDVSFFQALKIAEIPVPKEIERLDAQFPDKDILLQYQDAINKMVEPLEGQARIQWEKVINVGKTQRVSNEWTQLAQERLHDFVSQDEFPVLREELRQGTEQL